VATNKELLQMFPLLWNLRFFSFFLSLAFYWSFFPFLSLTGFFFCAVEGGEVAIEEERGGGHVDEAN
jgi:hypothetical protein